MFFLLEYLQQRIPSCRLGIFKGRSAVARFWLLMRIPMGWRKWLLIALAGASLCALLAAVLPGRTTRASGPSAYVTTGVFTPAHPTASAAIEDFLDFHPEHPVQPIAYTHTVHLAKGLPCTFCHLGVDQGPEARIPGVTVCMSCHGSIATDRPEIKKIAAYQARGEDIRSRSRARGRCR